MPSEEDGNRQKQFPPVCEANNKISSSPSIRPILYLGSQRRKTWTDDLHSASTTSAEPFTPLRLLTPDRDVVVVPKIIRPGKLIECVGRQRSMTWRLWAIRDRVARTDVCGLECREDSAPPWLLILQDCFESLPVAPLKVSLHGEADVIPPDGRYRGSPAISPINDADVPCGEVSADVATLP